MKTVLLLLLVALDALVVTPWLAAWGAQPGVDRAFWSLAIPLITSLVGAIAGKKKGAAANGGFDESSGEGTTGTGFDWGAAAPWLAAGGGAALGAMLGKKKKAAPAGGGVLDSMLAQQQARMQQNEPAQQALLSMASGMMPTYMKQPGGGLDQWQQGYEQRSSAAQQATPRPSYTRPPVDY